MKVVIDTREQNPLEFKRSKNFEGTVTKKLNVGDYSIEGFEDRIAVERKSAIDLFGTLGKGHKRFQKELERAKKLDYFCIVVEEPFSLVLNQSFEDAHYSKMKGYVVVAIIFTLKFKYGIDTVFCSNRYEASLYIRNLFKGWMKNDARRDT